MMFDPLITSEAALIGGGVWFADKIFGPSADAIGGQLKAYIQTRVPTIFGVAEAKAKELGITLGEIAPGLLARMIVDASFSSDEPEITEWWANLFLDASQKSSNKHAVFSDIMATLGPREAKCLDDFIKEFIKVNPHLTIGEMEENSALSHILVDELAKVWIGNSAPEGESFREAYVNLTTGGSPWPIRPVVWSVPIKSLTDIKMVKQINPWFSNNQSSIWILHRAGVFEFGSASVNLWDDNGWVRMVMLTSLGRDFYAACVGNDLRQGVAAVRGR